MQKSSKTKAQYRREKEIRYLYGYGAGAIKIALVAGEYPPDAAIERALADVDYSELERRVIAHFTSGGK